MRFSLRVAAWSLRYGLTQLGLFCLATVAGLAVGGLIVTLLASLAAWIVPPLVDRDLDARVDEAISLLVPHADQASATSLNSTAERLESVAAEAGVQLAPSEVPDRPQPTPQARDVFAAVSDELLGICRLEPPAVDLASSPRYEVWRRYHKHHIDQLIAILLEGVAPLWDNDPVRDREGPSTDLAGHLWWHRILVAEAAITVADGDGEAAVQALEASWRLNQFLLSSPQPTARATATAVLELQLAALRRCRLPAGGWPERLAALDPRRDALASYAYEAGRRSRNYTDFEPRPRILGLAARPFARLSMVHSRRAELTAILRLEGTGFAAFDPDQFAAEVIESVPRWNTVARSTLPTSWIWWCRSVHATLAAELTAQVLAVRGLDRSDALTDLGDPDAMYPSRIDGLAWRYEVDGRRVSIALDPDVFSPDGGFPLRESVDLDSRPPRPV
jgi:hypothetical protein